jgi:N-acetyl-beta-hexosaminidase
VIVQLWVEKNRMETLQNGNMVIMSDCGRCYTDRLYDWELQLVDFQNYVNVQDNYLFDPYTGIAEYRNQILGVEGCAWGGYLAERRLFNKIMPRLTALAEVCCCDPRQKFWTSFVKRDARQRDGACELIW